MCSAPDTNRPDARAVSESLVDALPRLLWSELDALSKDPSRDPDLRLAAWEEMQARDWDAAQGWTHEDGVDWPVA